SASLNAPDRGCVGLSFARAGARLDGQETNRIHSLVAFDVWIVPIRLVYHFLTASPDHVRSQPVSPWAIAFVLTAYGLLIAETFGAYIGVHFLWIAGGTSSRAKT